MRSAIVIVGVALSATTAMTAMAETAYVTDKLQLGLHQTPDTSGRPFRTLNSGQELDILSRDRYYAEVRLPDGTVGYVKAAYLVSEKPAVLIVEETRAENERLQRQLAGTKARFAGPAATIAALEQQVAERQATMDETTAKVSELTKENDRYVERQNQFQYSLPLTWVAGAMAVSLFVGFIGGLWWIDHQSRKRHGGVRIY